MSELEIFESGTSVQITFVASVAPDGPPRLEVADAAGTIVATATAVASSDTSFYSAFTTPDLPGVHNYVATWRATKTWVDGQHPIVQRVPFKVYQTGPGG